MSQELLAQLCWEQTGKLSTILLVMTQHMHTEVPLSPSTSPILELEENPYFSYLHNLAKQETIVFGFFLSLLGTEPQGLAHAKLWFLDPFVKQGPDHLSTNPGG